MAGRKYQSKEKESKPALNSASTQAVKINLLFQLEDNRPQSIIQKKKAAGLAKKENKEAFIQRKENTTGLPDQLKSGIENLSGHSMDDVKVHYNSSQPAQLNAHAYAQGSDIHLAPGQEKHLPHEAWHVVQQKQGRVKPTKQLKQKVNINDDSSLEKEADTMGNKTLQRYAFKETSKGIVSDSRNNGNQPVQRLKVINYGSGTTPKTLMKPNADLKTEVLNIDTGHMLLAKIIEDFLSTGKTKQLGGVVEELLKAYAESTREEASIPAIEKAAEAGDMAWMKHSYFEHVSGFEGVMREVGKMSPEARELFNKEAENLSNFRLGDAGNLTQNQGVDLIYCINGYGYSPLTDPHIFRYMHGALKPGGRLIIISEIMGPTVKPFLGFARKDRETLMKLFVVTRQENVITENPDPKATMNIVTRKEVSHLVSQIEPMRNAFSRLHKQPHPVAANDFFTYSQSSEIYISKSALLENDLLTQGMESHHTEGGGQLDDVIHVRLVFTKK